MTGSYPHSDSARWAACTIISAMPTGKCKHPFIWYVELHIIIKSSCLPRMQYSFRNQYPATSDKIKTYYTLEKKYQGILNTRTSIVILKCIWKRRLPYFHCINVFRNYANCIMIYTTYIDNCSGMKSEVGHRHFRKSSLMKLEYYQVGILVRLMIWLGVFPDPLTWYFLQGTKNILLRFTSFPYIDMTQVVGLFPPVRQELTYST